MRGGAPRSRRTARELASPRRRIWRTADAMDALQGAVRITWSPPWPRSVTGSWRRPVARAAPARSLRRRWLRAALR